MIFLAGVSGSGKSYAVQRVLALVPDLRVLRASTLLQEAGRPLYSLTKRAAIENQATLLAALRNRPAPDCMEILDGHAVVETVEGPFALPEAVFDSAGLSAIAVVVAEPTKIANRRRDGRFTRDPAAVDAAQAMEIEHCRRLASRLEIPFHMVRSGDVEHLYRILTGGRPQEPASGSVPLKT